MRLDRALILIDGPLGGLSPEYLTQRIHLIQLLDIGHARSFAYDPHLSYNHPSSRTQLQATMVDTDFFTCYV